MKLNECQTIVVVFIVFVIVWILLKMFVRDDESGQSKRETLDDVTIRKYAKDTSTGYYGPVNFTRETGFAVLGDPFVNPAPLYRDDPQPLWSQIPPYNSMAVNGGF